MISRPTGRFRHHAGKAQSSQVEFVNEDLDDADRIVLCHRVFQALRQQCRLPPILTFNESRHSTHRWSESHYQSKGSSHRLDPRVNSCRNFRSEGHKSELKSRLSTWFAVFGLKNTSKRTTK